MIITSFPFSAHALHIVGISDTGKQEAFGINLF